MTTSLQKTSKNHHKIPANMSGKSKGKKNTRAKSCASGAVSTAERRTVTKEQEELLKALESKRRYNLDRYNYHAQALYDLEKAIRLLKSNVGIEFAHVYDTLKAY